MMTTENSGDVDSQRGRIQLACKLHREAVSPLRCRNIESRRCQRNTSRRRWGTASVETAVIICGLGCVVLAIGQVIAGSANETFSTVHSELSNPGLATGNQNTGVQNPAGVLRDETPTGHILQSATIVALIACTIGLFLVYFRKQTRSPEENDEEETESKPVNQKVKKRSVALTNVLAKRNEILARLEGSWEVIMDGRAVVSTYMSRDLFSVDPGISTEAAYEQLNAKGFRRCMVTNHAGKLLGVVSKKDILSKTGDLVQDVMTNKPRVATPDMEIHIALSILLENRISCLPVIDRGRLVGIVSTSDLLMVLQCLLLELSIHNKNSNNDRSVPTIAPSLLAKEPFDAVGVRSGSWAQSVNL